MSCDVLVDQGRHPQTHKITVADTSRPYLVQLLQTSATARPKGNDQLSGGA